MSVPRPSSRCGPSIDFVCVPEVLVGHCTNKEDDATKIHMDLQNTLRSLLHNIVQ